MALGGFHNKMNLVGKRRYTINAKARPLILFFYGLGCPFLYVKFADPQKNKKKIRKKKTLNLTMN